MKATEQAERVPVGYALQWEGKPVNIHTTFPTQEIAEKYVSHCEGEHVTIVPLYI